MRNRPGVVSPAGLEVIKLEYILRLKIKRNDWLLADTCPQAANHCALFESETVLRFEARHYLRNGDGYQGLIIRSIQVSCMHQCSLGIAFYRSSGRVYTCIITLIII